MQTKPEPETVDREYKDKATDLLKSSSYDEKRPTGDMNGEGLESTSPNTPAARGQQEWRDGAAEEAQTKSRPGPKDS